MIYFYVYTSVGQPAALEALFCGPLTFSRNRKFRGKSTKSLKLSEKLALMNQFFENVALDLIWVGRRCATQWNLAK
jgi:hypothetical protein